jgi:HlyD family secretion protein
MKRNLTRIGVLVLVVVLVAGAFGWQRMTASAAPATRTLTVKVTRGSLAATVSAAGNVSAPGSVALAFSSSGRVAMAPVRVGDQVKAGQLLMQLDTTDLQLALKTAQTTLASQQASFDATQANLQFALRVAQTDLDSAQASYDAAKAENSTNGEQLTVAKATLDQVRIALETAQMDYNAVAWQPNIGMTSQATALQTASQEYQTALANYNITVAGINDGALKTAQASLDSAQVALEQAQKNMDTSLRTAEASLESAQLAVQQAQRNLDNASLYAPFDGLVSAVNYNPGDSAGTSTAVSVVDLSSLQVQVSIAEVDVARIKVGETAQVTMDALPDKTYTGQVIAVGPVGTVTSGVVNYPVTVALTDADEAVKPGLTANLAVEVDRRDDVLVVPARAMRTQGTQKIVTVVRNGKSIETPVNTGLSGDTMIEVTSGLNEGDQVVVNQTQTTQSNRGGVGIMLPGLGGPGGPPPN